jgi:N-acetyl sugar amidotransferase
VAFCKHCVISNQRPNSAVEFQHTQASRKATINFDDEGVCDACRFAEQKRGTIDWKDREDRLAALCDRFRSKSGYDCLVPGSGGKDSFYASHVLKTRFGMHPLTVTWAPHVYTEWGLEELPELDPCGARQLPDDAERPGSPAADAAGGRPPVAPFQAFILGQKSLAPKMAILHDIPFVVYGENEAEYGNPIGDTNSAKRDWSYFAGADTASMYLGGTSIKSLYEDFDLEPQDLLPYLPADPAQVAARQVEVHYLGYYLKWHPQSCYYYAVEHGGFEASPERTPGTYSKYNSIDDRIDDYHYHTTFIKFGIGRATYDAAQEIRSGDITRDEGVALVRRYDGEFPERFADEIFRYLSIPEKEFPKASKMFEQPVMDRAYYLRLCDQFRSPHLWRREAGQWKLRHTVFDAA